jgi:hypothetical protein
VWKKKKDIVKRMEEEQLGKLEETQRHPVYTYLTTCTL